MVEALPPVKGASPKSVRFAIPSESDSLPASVGDFPDSALQSQVLVELDAGDLLSEPLAAADPSTGSRRDQSVEPVRSEPWWKRRAQAKSAAKHSIAANKRRPVRQPSAVKAQRTATVSPRNSMGTAAQTGKSELDSQDRMFDRAEFSKIQRMIGLKFTLDACCNPDGNNALVQECFKSAQDSFLDLSLIHI